jgi:hypothetical protein
MSPELEAAKVRVEKAMYFLNYADDGDKALALLVSAIEERQWVNVSNRLPKTGGNGKSEWILIYDRDAKRIHIGYYNSNHRCFYDWIGVESFTSNPTHWMPLPGHPVEIVEGSCPG